jgi:hypothetical protein
MWNFVTIVVHCIPYKTFNYLKYNKERENYDEANFIV